MGFRCRECCRLNETRLLTINSFLVGRKIQSHFRAFIENVMLWIFYIEEGERDVRSIIKRSTHNLSY